jgi:hypothetical protein
MMKGVLKSLSSKVMDAVGSVIGDGAGTADEKLELYKARLQQLSSQMALLKDSIAKHGRAYQSLVVSGSALNDQLMEFYGSASRGQASLPIFTNATNTMQGNQRRAVSSCRYLRVVLSRFCSRFLLFLVRSCARQKHEGEVGVGVPETF